MPWEGRSLEQQREELVCLALSGGVSLSELCRRHGVSRETLYKWIRRFRSEEGFSDRSRRPLRSPARTSSELEAVVLKLRREHPRWGARKLRRILENEGLEKIPSPSTLTEILRIVGKSIE